MATPAVGTRKRSRGQDSARQNNTRSYNSHDIHFEHKQTDNEDNYLFTNGPVVAAILPCLGAFFLGADYIQDAILFICVTWYLHMLIQVPWELYTLSRPRSMSRQARTSMLPDQKAAEAALQWRSLLYLGLAIGSPFAGLQLLRTILVTVGAADANGPYITLFHGTLFVLVAGMRPLTHAIEMVMGNTRELQGVVHHPPGDQSTELFDDRLERLEVLVSDLSSKLYNIDIDKAEEHAKREQGLITVQDSFDRTAARLEEGARRREKKTEVSVELMERKIEGLEKKIDSLTRFATEREREQLNGYVYPKANGHAPLASNTTGSYFLRLRSGLNTAWVLVFGDSKESDVTTPRELAQNRRGQQHPNGTISLHSPRSSGILKKRRPGSLVGDNMNGNGLQTVFEEGSEGDLDFQSLSTFSGDYTQKNRTKLKVEFKEDDGSGSGGGGSRVPNIRVSPASPDFKPVSRPSSSSRISSSKNTTNKKRRPGLVRWALSWFFAPLILAKRLVAGVMMIFV